MRRLVAAAITIALLAGGCGGDGSSESACEASAAVMLASAERAADAERPFTAMLDVLDEIEAEKTKGGCDYRSGEGMTTEQIEQFTAYMKTSMGE